MQRREAIADTQKTMPAAATRPTGKRSRRGRLSEGAPTKRTSEVIQKIADAIALGLRFHGLTSFRADQSFATSMHLLVSLPRRGLGTA